MTVTASGAVRSIGTAAASVNAVLGSDVPAGATIIVGILNRSDESATITDIDDPVNGDYTLIQGPTDSSSSTFRTWLYRFSNSAALSGAGNRTITVDFSGSINSQVVACYLTSDQGVLTYDAVATALNTALSQTNVDSNTVSAAGAGCIIGFLALQNSQADPEPTADGSGESRINAGEAGARTFLFLENNASAGSYGIETTCDSTAAIFHVAAFTEPAGSDYTLTADQGSYTLIGSAALVDLVMNAGQGSYDLTGQAAGLLMGFPLTAESGSYTLTGQNAFIHPDLASGALACNTFAMFLFRRFTIGHFH